MRLILIVILTSLGYCQEHTDRPVSIRFCQLSGCSQGCRVSKPGTILCSCIMGFKIQNDGVSCRDVDECSEFPRLCQYGCNNTIGSFMCTCPPGYSLRDDGRTCREFSDYREAPCGKSSSDIPCNKKSGRCETGKCMHHKDKLETNEIHEIPHEMNPKTIKRDSQSQSATGQISNSSYINDLNDTNDAEKEDIYTNSNVPPCLGGDCEFGNFQEILTDCTGSGCPPKDRNWYERFLGISVPDHNYFDRMTKLAETKSKRQIQRRRKPEINEQAKLRSRTGSFSYLLNVAHKAEPKLPPTIKRKLREDGLLSDEPNCRDDLCISQNENDQFTYEIDSDSNTKPFEFDCPLGYYKERRGAIVFCKPREIKPLTGIKTDPRCKAGEQLVRTSGREFCIPVKPKPFHRTPCPKDQVPMKTDNGLVCVDLLHKDTVICQDGQVAMETRYGTICVHNDSKQNQIPALEGDCKPGQVSIQTPAGFVCVEEVSPRPMCSPGTVPQTINGRLLCIPPSDCLPGEIAIPTETGVVCQGTTTTSSYATTTEASATTERQCPYGLVPLQTSVGRVCRYLPPKQRNKKKSCPYGMQARNKDGLIECVHNHQSDNLDCPKGQTLIKTDNGNVCGIKTTVKNDCRTGIYDKYGKCVNSIAKECPEGQIQRKYENRIRCVPDIHTCPFGFTMVRGKCQDLNLNNLCPVSQMLVETVTGFDCIYRHPSRTGQGTNVDCSSGEILSQAMRNFYCETYEVPTSEILSCGSGSVFVKVGGGYACITEFEASLQCTETEVLIRLPGGFTCIPMKGSSKKHQEIHCGAHEVAVTDEKGFRKCISLDIASEVCGDGYKAVKMNREFVCKVEKIDLRCPEDYILSLDGAAPVCVSDMDINCVPVGGKLTPKCHEKALKGSLQPCEDGYQLAEVEGMFECHIRQPDVENCSDRNCHGTDCKTGENGDTVRPCDIDPKILLFGCNPDCANGGTCNNGTCECPKGITGRACNEDVDECAIRSGICEFNCKNTFGSFHCVCPPGMTLLTDGRTCEANVCSPDCLNGGVCTNGRCRCPRGFAGDFCQTDIDECALYGERLCQHLCRNTQGSYSCICPLGTRLNADRRTCTNTTCIPSCRNGGQCENNRCVCPKGFYGIVCQLDVNECYKNNPCSHSCVNLRGSYKCTCPTGYTLQEDGLTCNHDNRRRSILPASLELT